MLSDDELSTYYSAYYTSESIKKAYRLTNEEARKTLYENFSRTRLRRMRAVAPTGRYLEIGCGEGASLAAARDAGYEVVGIDIAENAIAIAQRYGLDARQLRLEDLKEADGSFDVIYSWHTIEHVTNLRSFMSKCARLLKDDGWLFIGTENPEALFHRAYAALHRLSGEPIPLNSSSSEHTYLLSPRFIRTRFPEFRLRLSRIRAYEEWRWVARRMQSPLASKRILKWAVWGGLSLAAHLLNSGTMLQIEARKQ